MIGSKLHKGSVIYDATTGVENGQILHDGTYTATTTPASTDTLLIKQSGVQKQITRNNLLYPAETVLNLTQANFTNISGSSYILVLTSSQIENNDAIIVQVNPTGAGQDFTLSVPNNTKPIRIWLSTVNSPNNPPTSLTINATKAANELVKLVFDQSVSFGASNIIADASFYLVAGTNYGLIYENINGKQKMLTQVYQNEI